MVQREVEVKILEVDRSAMEQKLVSLGAEKIFDDDMKLHSFKTSDDVGLLRVRKEGDDTFLVVKMRAGSDDFARETDEYSVKVDDYEGTVHILELLGFPPKWRYSKHRTSYRLDGIRFEFDKLLGAYDFVPEYLELEAADIPSLHAMLKKIGVAKDEVVSWTGGDVIRHYEKK